MAGESLRIKGDIIGSEDLRFEGQIDGTISLPGHTLIVGPQARINARVEAKTIVVAGSLTGTVKAHERFELHAQGRLEGELDAPRISVQEGGYLRATVTMPGKAKAESEPSKKKSAAAADAPAAGAPAAEPALQLAG